MTATRGLLLALALVLPACFNPNGDGTTSTGDSSTSTGQTTTGAPDPSTTSTTTTSPTSSSGTAQTSEPDPSSTSGDSSSSADPGTTSTTTSTDDTSTTSTSSDASDSSDGSTMPMTTGKQDCMLPAQCPKFPGECIVADCVANVCEFVELPPGAPCKGGLDQCDGNGNCIECVDNEGCEMGLSCENNLCVPN